MSQNKNQDNEFGRGDFEYVNLFEIFLFFWKKKFVFVFFMILSIIYSSYVLRNSSFEYEVKLDLIPINQSSGIGSASLQNFSQLFGLSSKQVQPNLGLYRSLIKSYSIAEILSKDKDFLKLLAGSSWDDKTNSLKPHVLSNLSRVKIAVKKLLGIPVFEIKRSNSSFVFSVLSGLKFRPSTAGMTEVVFQTDNPELGSLILMKAHKATEHFLKERSIKKTLRNINFIDEKLSQPQKADHRSSLIRILSDLQKTLMISSSDMPYSVEAFNERPIVSDYPVSPNAKIILIFNATISIIISSIFILILVLLDFRKRKIKK